MENVNLQFAPPGYNLVPIASNLETFAAFFQLDDDHIRQEFLICRGEDFRHCDALVSALVSALVIGFGASVVLVYHVRKSIQEDIN